MTDRQPMTNLEVDNSKVICPNCCHQFGAISVSDQKARRDAADEIGRLQALCLESAHFMAEDFATPLEDSVVSPRYLTHYKALLALRCTDEPSTGES